MLNRRSRLVPALASAALIGAAALVPSSPAQAEPNIDDVKSQVDSLYHQAEQASERLNDAKLQLKSLRRDLGVVQGDQDTQAKQMRQARNRVRDSIVRTYEGDSLSAFGQVVLSDDPQSFLDQMSAMDTYDSVNDELFDSYSTAVKALDIRRQATEQRAEQIAKLRDQLASDKKTVDDKYGEAKALLDRLEAKQRAEIVSRSSDRTEMPVVPASGRAAAAVAYARAQVGKAYVYGAAGPSAFDCSGLTMMAWAQAGVSLPHSSSAQYSSGPHIPESELQPGDLVFYYSPISHVGMYIGGGMIVHAANPSTGVAIASLHSMPYVGAVRPG
ncbi:C40 family peptidase [Nocardioides acrostichi]|uniref:C40 family peptidase n=1 Tax=Nocardioides acrostichi TaxID=2784339 RepID=A0A930UUR3_9ACTN|nr:C40 family peptidase [Nocardioides acrostichi]MBF4160556.1 C40 family peptidase [Nocardioides acrostichi]